MQPTLPAEFTTWTQALTDWAVGGAFQKVGPPRCFGERTELAVPLVVEIGQTIRQKRLREQSIRVLLLRESVVEPTFEKVGGSDYIELREAMEGAQEQYFRMRRERSGNAGDLETLRLEMVRHQTDFIARRRRHAVAALTARKAAARKFWAARPARCIPDTFFADSPTGSAAARMQRIHPPWWGRFLRSLQQTLAYGHPAEGRLLEALPRLRAQARVKTFAAMVAEWHETHADKWGWYGPIHHTMLVPRSIRKADRVKTWFDTVAPGYLTDGVVREQLHEALRECLVEADPWTTTVHPWRAGLSADGPN